MKVTNICFVPASRDMQRTGLRGWSNVVIDDRWYFDGLAVRRTRQGGAIVTFPARVDANGVEHPIVRPLDETTRRTVVDAVLAHVRKGGWLE